MKVVLQSHRHLKSQIEGPNSWNAREEEVTLSVSLVFAGQIESPPPQMTALTTSPSHMENITPRCHLYHHAIIPWSMALAMCVCACTCVGARLHQGVRWMLSLTACILASLLCALVDAAPSHAAKIKHQSESLVSVVGGNEGR